MDDSGQVFGKYYYAHNCGGIPYDRSEIRLQAFDRFAARLIADFSPKTVLDAGCAWGFLVERLRARGVEAWGIDISEYAIQNVSPEIRDYCSVGSITMPFSRKYDLIVSIEVLEHMPPEDSDLAVENLCQFTDNLVVSIAPYDFKEATHFNVQPPDYWARRFARYGFFHDVDYDGSYITPWTARYYRLQGSVQPVVQAYERKLWHLQTEIKELRSSLVEHMGWLQEAEHRTEELRKQLEYLQQQPVQPESAGAEQAWQEKIILLEAQLRASNTRWEDAQSGMGWQLLQKAQQFRVRLAPQGSRRERLLHTIFGRRK